MRLIPNSSMPKQADAKVSLYWLIASMVRKIGKCQVSCTVDSCLAAQGRRHDINFGCAYGLCPLERLIFDFRYKPHSRSEDATAEDDLFRVEYADEVGDGH